MRVPRALHVLPGRRDVGACGLSLRLEVLGPLLGRRLDGAHLLFQLGAPLGLGRRGVTLAALARSASFVRPSDTDMSVSFPRSSPARPLTVRGETRVHQARERRPLEFADGEEGRSSRRRRQWTGGPAARPRQSSADRQRTDPVESPPSYRRRQSTRSRREGPREPPAPPGLRTDSLSAPHPATARPGGRPAAPPPAPNRSGWAGATGRSGTA